MKRRPNWTEAQTRRLLELCKSGLHFTQIAKALNREFDGDWTSDAVGSRAHKLGFTYRKGKTAKVRKRCLTCRNIFETESPRQIHICDSCKTQEIFSGAA